MERHAPRAALRRGDGRPPGGGARRAERPRAPRGDAPGRALALAPRPRGKKARKRVEARLGELRQRAKRNRQTLARSVDDAVARALAALNIPTPARSSAAAAAGRGAEGTGRAPALVRHSRGRLVSRAKIRRAMTVRSQRSHLDCSRMTRARKPTLRHSRMRRSKVALVCAGGGVTGAVYEIGCLRALDELHRPRARRPRPVRRHLRRRLRRLPARGRRPAARDVRRGDRPAAGSPLGAAAAECSGSAAWSSCAAPAARRASWPGRCAPACPARAATGATWCGRCSSCCPPGLLDTSGIQEYLAARLPRAPEERPLRRPAARAQRGRGRPRQRRGRRLRPPRPPRRADLARRSRPRPRCRACTARSASRAATTWTAASRRPRTSTWRSRAAPTS